MLRLIARRLREERGATSALVALMMMALLGVAAIAIDIGALQARKAQVQDAADAAALAIARQCAIDPGSSFGGCSVTVAAGAEATAAWYGAANLGDGVVTVEAVEFPTASTVRVQLSSPQAAYFAGFLPGEDWSANTVRADATAEWSPPAYPLSLAMAACAFPEPGQATVVQASLAVTNLLGTLLGDECGLLASGNLLSGVGHTVGLVAGGWLTSSEPILGLTPGSCEYDPNLLTTIAATVSKIAPTSCAQAVAGWGASPSAPTRVILPVFDDGLEQLVVDDVLGIGTIDRFAVLDVTGYSFSGLLGLSTVPGSDPALCTSTDGVLGSALTAAIAGLLPIVLDLLGGLAGILGGVTGCQALAGTFVGFVDAEGAAALLDTVRLID